MRIHVSCFVFSRPNVFFPKIFEPNMFFTCCTHSQNMLLDLPSSALAVDFADNTNNSFKVSLLQKLVLEPGEWEVGALVAHIPSKFYNIVAGGVTLQSPRARQT